MEAPDEIGGGGGDDGLLPRSLLFSLRGSSVVGVSRVEVPDEIGGGGGEDRLRSRSLLVSLGGSCVVGVSRVEAPDEIGSGRGEDGVHPRSLFFSLRGSCVTGVPRSTARDAMPLVVTIVVAPLPRLAQTKGEGKEGEETERRGRALKSLGQRKGSKAARFTSGERTAKPCIRRGAEGASGMVKRREFSMGNVAKAQPSIIEISKMLIRFRTQ